jgi:probable H4MPT-linked C1 transfer pathway protein
MNVLGLDIGGANIKAASTAGAAHSEPFAIWKAPQELAARLQQLITRFPRPDRLAVTMTAELADCFATKAEGVAAIVAATCEAAPGIPVAFWQTSGKFASAADATAAPRLTAAANWHALATWAGRLAPRGTAVLLDIGSTTTDIIPLSDGQPVPRGRTDVERLLNHELIYTGLRRTPLCAVATSVPVRGHPCPVAAELFATMLDVYLLLGLIPEDPLDHDTSDGRPATVSCAHDRIARIVCCDREELDLDAARSLASAFAAAQHQQIAGALSAIAARDARPLATIIVSGSGEQLARKVLAEHPAVRTTQIISLAESLAPGVTDAACAWAVAVLAAEER